MIWCERVVLPASGWRLGSRPGAAFHQSRDFCGSIVVVIILVVTVGDGFEVEFGDHLALCV
jgi:hypothetical protein